MNLNNRRPCPRSMVHGCERGFEARRGRGSLGPRRLLRGLELAAAGVDLFESLVGLRCIGERLGLDVFWLRFASGVLAV